MFTGLTPQNAALRRQCLHAATPTGEGSFPGNTALRLEYGYFGHGKEHQDGLL